MQKLSQDKLQTPAAENARKEACASAFQSIDVGLDVSSRGARK
jgi:hypothetical protein